MTATWPGKAGQILAALESLALPNGKNTLFNPLPLKLSPGKVSVTMQAASKTAFLVAELDFPAVVTEAQVTVDALELIKFLGGYDAGEDVVIHFSDPVKLVGANRTCTIHPEAAQPHPLGSAVPKFVDGVVQYAGAPAGTIVKVDAAALQVIIKDAQTVEVPAFPLQAVPGSGLKVSLGGLEAKKNSINRSVPATVEGAEASTVIGEDFVYVMSHATGPVTLQMNKEKHPLVIVAGQVRYILLPRTA